MIDYPVKLLAVGYGIAALIGFAAWGVGAPAWVSLMLVWIGGALIVLALATLPATARRFQCRSTEVSRNLVSEEEYRLWDDDLLLEQIDLPVRRSGRG